MAGVGVDVVGPRRRARLTSGVCGDDVTEATMASLTWEFASQRL